MSRPKYKEIAEIINNGSACVKKLIERKQLSSLNFCFREILIIIFV
jgi:hypothetical protein